jgi:uncharacterized membrane protein YcaP (DUF421 family)
MDLTRIAVRAVVTFAFLLVLVRLSGKRVVSEGTAFDFVFALVLGDLVDNAIWAEVPMVQFFVAAGALAVAEVATEVGAYASGTLRWLLEGRPRLVLRDGRPCEAGVGRELLTDHEIERMLRERGIDRGERYTVHRAWIETSGDVSIFKHYRARGAQKRDRDRLE